VVRTQFAGGQSAGGDGLTSDEWLPHDRSVRDASDTAADREDGVTLGGSRDYDVTLGAAG